jgi:hypothetical protein
MWSWIAAPLLGWFAPRPRAVAIAALLPIIEYWISSGLDPSDRNGYENWGLLVLPVQCLVAMLLAAAAGSARRRLIARARGTE